MRLSKETGRDGAEVPAPFDNLAHSLFELGHRGALSDDAVAAKFEEFANRIGGEIGRNRDESRFWVFLSELAKDFDSVQTRKEKIKDNQFRFLVLAKLETFTPVEGFSYNRHSGYALCHARDQIPEHYLVFDYNNSRLGCIHTSEKEPLKPIRIEGVVSHHITIKGGKVNEPTIINKANFVGIPT